MDFIIQPMADYEWIKSMSYSCINCIQLNIVGVRARTDYVDRFTMEYFGANHVKSVDVLESDENDYFHDISVDNYSSQIIDFDSDLDQVRSLLTNEEFENDCNDDLYELCLWLIDECINTRFEELFNLIETEFKLILRNLNKIQFYISFIISRTINIGKRMILKIRNLDMICMFISRNK